MKGNEKGNWSMTQDVFNYLKFLDEEIRQIVAWVVHRKSVEGEETKWSESLQVISLQMSQIIAKLSHM